MNSHMRPKRLCVLVTVLNLSYSAERALLNSSHGREFTGSNLLTIQKLQEPTSQATLLWRLKAAGSS